MDVFPVPCLNDNYAYLVCDHDTKSVAVVDPVEPDKILSAAPPEYKITHVLTTHKHMDHAGGNERIAELVPGICVVGSRDDDVPACTQFVGDGDSLKIGSLDVQCLHVPCHTRGHMLYVVNGTDLFCGDTLFVGGCGRFFEGSASDMYNALCVKIGLLKPETRVWCGHEYTLNNYKFASSVEPGNDTLKQCVAEAQRKRDNNEPTVPSTLAIERATNPFMRVDEAVVQAFTGTKDPVDTMKVLREKKNSFGLGAAKKK